MLMTSLKKLRKVEDKSILILSVDIDDDLGKAGIKAPIVGYANVLKALLEFGKKRPEDSDVNGIFKALSLYDELKASGYNVEVAVLAGHPSSSLKASLRVKSDLEKLCSEKGFRNIVLVSDGASDEQIIPVIQGVANIIGVERVIVEQSKGIEETFLLLSRYVKKAVNELPYSKVFLGIPGALLVIVALINLLKLTMYINEVVFLFLGGILIIKGFGLTSRAIEVWRKSPILFLSYLLGFAIYLVAFLTISYTIYIYGLTPSSFVFIVDSTKALLILGTLAIVSGRLIYKMIYGLEEMLWKESLLLIPFIFVVVILQKISDKVKTIGPTESFNTLISEVLTPDLVTLVGLSIVVSIVTAFIFIVLERERMH